MTTTAKRLRPWALLAVLGMTLGTMSGCSGDDKAQEDKPKASASASATKAPEEAIKTAEASPSSSPSPSVSQAPAPSPDLKDAFNGYGNSADVQTIDPTIPGTWYAGEYVAQNAKRDIQIIMLDDEVRIYSANWNTTNPYGTMPESGVIANGIVLTAGEQPNGVTAYEEWPMGQPTEEGGDYRDAQVIENGQALKHGTYVCGSDDKGVTCWNTNTGHGAFVTEKGFTGF